MSSMYNRSRYYITAITIITLISAIFTGYLYQIYITQKNTIKAQAHSLSVAKTLNELIFDTRRILGSGNSNDLSVFVEQFNNYHLVSTENDVISDESVQKYIEFRKHFLSELKSLIKLKKNNYSLRNDMVTKAIVAYNSVLRMAHDFSAYSKNYSEDITELAKELAIEIAGARQIDRDFQLEASIQKKERLISLLQKSILMTEDKLTHLKIILEKEEFEEDLNEIQRLIEQYRSSFQRFAQVHIEYSKKKVEIEEQLERIDSFIADNSVKQYKYLNQYNNATKLFLVGLVLFFAGIVIFIAFIFNAYSSSKRSQELEHHKNIEKSRFLARMSHEIRTPLNGILGTIGLMQNDSQCQNCGNARENMNALSSSSISLKNHIDNILDISKIEAGMMELNRDRFSPDDLFRQIENIVRPLITDTKCTVSFSGQSNLDIGTDKTKLRQVVLNYVSNALKYSDPRKSNHRVDVSYTVLRYSKKSALLNIEVKDNGIGMSSNQIAAFGKPFRQFEGKSGSTGQWQTHSSGLGANVAKSYVKLLGGRVVVESSQGSGTQIRVLIKVDVADPVPSEMLNVKQELTLRKPLNVLIIEDNHFNRQILNRQLTLLGCKVTSMNDGLEAKNHLLSKINTYDLFITDIKMPNMDGVQLTRFIRNELQSETPVVALTADALKQDHSLFAQVGINKVLTKPILLDDLNLTLSQLADSVPQTT